MSTRALFIPDRIKVGFQDRKGTYTGRLAYVIYFDKKNVLRKEKSWEGWRDKKIDPLEFGNEPIDGFVLNKGVGGQRHSYGWHARNEYIRVYDPRDFEFEISVANLLFILRECDCSRGKGLEGRFVYAWNGTELILLPENSVDYQESRKYTDLQGQKVRAKELIPGVSYTTKRLATLTYVGRFDYYVPLAHKGIERVGKKFVFWTGDHFVYEDSLKNIARLHSDAVTPDYAELVDRYNKSEFGSRVVELFTKKTGPSLGYHNPWVTQDEDGTFLLCETRKHYGYSYGNFSNDISYVNTLRRCYVNDNGLICEPFHTERYRPGQKPKYYRAHQGILVTDAAWIEPTEDRLWARLESGSEFRVMDGGLAGINQ